MIIDKLKFIIGVFLINALLLITGCNNELTSEASTGQQFENAKSQLTVSAQNTIELAPQSKGYFIDLSSKMSSSDGSPVRLSNVVSLTDSDECKILAVSSIGFSVQANDYGVCDYEYTATAIDMVSASQLQLEPVQAYSELPSARAITRVARAKETIQLKAISSTTNQSTDIIIDILTELAANADTTDMSNFTLNNLSTLSDPLSTAVVTTDVVNNTIMYTPEGDFSGVERILYSYQDLDGNILLGTIDVAVSTGVNIAPIALNHYYLYNGDGPIPNSTDVFIDITPYISDVDTAVSELQLIDVFSYNLNTEVANDFDGDGNIFNDKVVKFNSNSAGEVSFTYTVTDHRGGYATGVIAFTVAGVYENIFVTSVQPNFLVSPPYTENEALLAGVLFLPGVVGSGLMAPLGIVNAEHNWTAANGLCEAKGGSLPTVNNLTALYNEGNLFLNHNYPIDLPYWTNDDGVSGGGLKKAFDFNVVDLSSAVLDDNDMSMNYRVMCVSENAVSVEIIGMPIISLSKTSITKVEQKYELQATRADGTTYMVSPELISWNYSFPTGISFDSESQILTADPLIYDFDNDLPFTLLARGKIEALSSSISLSVAAGVTFKSGDFEFAFPSRGMSDTLYTKTDLNDNSDISVGDPLYIPQDTFDLSGAARGGWCETNFGPEWSLAGNRVYTDYYSGNYSTAYGGDLINALSSPIWDESSPTHDIAANITFNAISWSTIGYWQQVIALAADVPQETNVYIVYRDVDKSYRKVTRIGSIEYNTTTSYTERRVVLLCYREI